jgi:glycosyltransferase involved in cell wall biosynthesis
MRVLFFTHHYLDDNSGGSFASRAYINAFSEIADTCMLMYPDRGIPVSDFIHKKCILKGIKDEHTKVQKVIDIYRGRIHRYADVMIPEIQEFKPDVVVFDNSRTSAGMLKKVKKSGVKTIVIHHNYEMEYYRGTKPFIAWRFPFMHYMEEAERTAVQFGDLNLTLTDEDKSLLQMHYDRSHTSKIAKLGTFESMPEQPTLSADAKAPKLMNDICFAITGTLGSYQTEVSVIPFLEEDYPELLNVLADSKLIVAGRNPSIKVINACAKYPSVKLIANPQNMQEVIAQADVYICPTCVGGGLKLRVMDGLKAGLPVLTHAVSARGYDEFRKADCLFVYHDKNSFRAALQKLLQAMKEGGLDVTSIKNTYTSIFSFEAGVQRLRDLLSENGLF